MQGENRAQREIWFIEQSFMFDRKLRVSHDQHGLDINEKPTKFKKNCNVSS